MSAHWTILGVHGAGIRWKLSNFFFSHRFRCLSFSQLTKSFANNSNQLSDRICFFQPFFKLFYVRIKGPSLNALGQTLPESNRKFWRKNLLNQVSAHWTILGVHGAGIRRKLSNFVFSLRYMCLSFSQLTKSFANNSNQFSDQIWFF